MNYRIYFKINTLTILLALLVLFACNTPTKAQLPEKPDSVDLSAYPWMLGAFNKIQFYDRNATNCFYQQWKISNQNKLSVVHLGDSHLQADIYPGQIRKKMHKLHGDGGRGLMFAFSTAKTYSSVDYKSTHTGVWTAARSITVIPKLPLGVRGMTCNTKQAGASLGFQFAAEVPNHYDMLKIFYKKTPNTYDLRLKIGTQTLEVLLDTAQNVNPYVAIQLPTADKNLSLQTIKNRPEQNEFEFYGMSLETSQDSGAVWHNAGVGAARSHAVLYQKLFKAQLPSLNPDLVIIDFGTNDYLYDDKIKPELEEEIKKVIQTVRDVCPNTSILLTTAQDLYWKRVNVRSGIQFSELIHKIAQETSCMVYDWYWVAGGQRAMLKWVQAKTAQTDNVHLTWKGYQLKGDLLFEALTDLISWLETNPDVQRILPTDSLKTAQAKYGYVYQPSTPAQVTVATDGKKSLQYTIKRGDTLSLLARRYNVSVMQLKAWNNLKNDVIYVGNTLTIYQ